MKKYISFWKLSGSIGLIGLTAVFLIFQGGFSTNTKRANAYDPAWQYRVAVTLDSGYANFAYTGIPIQVDLSNLPSNFFTNVNSDGSDIRITESDGTTELPREVVTIDTAGGTGELYFKGDVAYDVDNTYYIYYGNAGATEPASDSTYGSEAVWTDYTVVHHFNNFDGSEFIDSTGNGNNFTKNSSFVTTTAGNFGGGSKALSITKAGGNVYMPTQPVVDIMPTSSFAITMFVYNPNTKAVTVPFFGFSGQTIADQYLNPLHLVEAALFVGDGVSKAFNIGSFSTLANSDGYINYGVYQVDGSYVGFKLNNGDISNSLISPYNGTKSFVLGTPGFSDYADGFVGLTDEFRIASEIPASGGAMQLKQEFEWNMFTKQESFFTMGTEESVGGVGNTAPEVTIGIPKQTIGSERVTVTTTISDIDLDETDLQLEVSTNGTIWVDLRTINVSVSEGEVTTSSAAVNGVDTDIDGSVDLTVTWEAGADFDPDEYATMYIRIQASDGTAQSSYTTSTAFALDLQGPTALGPITFLNNSVDAIYYPTVTSSDANFNRYLIYWDTAPGVTTSSYFANSVDDADFSGSSEFNFTKATTTIPNTTYYFKIFAEDDFGHTTSSIESSTTTIPTNPKAPRFDDSITSTSLYMYWAIGNNPTSTVYDVYDVDAATIIATTTADGITLTGLTPDTLYTYQVRARNAENPSVNSGYGASASIRTAPYTPNPPTLAATGTSTLDISFGAFLNNTSTRYAFYNIETGNHVSTLGFLGSKVSSLVSSTWGDPVTVNVLDINTAYTFQTIANNGSGAATSTDSNTVYTYAAAPLALAASNITTSSIRLDWQDNSNPGATVYEVRDNSDVLVATSTDVFYVATGLAQDTEYSFKVRALNGDGVPTAYTSTVTTSTAAAIPTDPTNVVLSSVATSSLTVSWTDNSSDETAFLIDITTSTFPGVTSTVAADSTNTVLSGLTPNTSYTVRVQALGASVNSGYATSTATTTQANTPDGVTFGGTTTTIAFIWQANGNPDGTMYEAEHINSSLVVTTTDTFYSFDNTGFTPGETQRFRVRAVNDAGVYTDYASGYSITAPISPTTPTTTVVNATTINISLNAEVNGASTTYAIYDTIGDEWVDTDGTMTGAAVYQAFADWVSPTAITGLTPNTEHSFVVYANTADIFSATSSPSTAVFTYAAVPTDFATSSVATSSIGLSWSANGNAAGTVYTVSTTDQVVTTTDTSITISNLAFDTAYTFELFATNGANLDTASVTTSASTDYYNYTPVVQTVTPAQTTSSTASIAVQAGDLNAFFAAGTAIRHTFSFTTSSTSGPWTAMSIDSATNDDSASVSVLGQDTVSQALTNAGTPPNSPEIDGFSIVWDIATDLAGYNGTVCVQVVTDDQRGGVVTTTPDCIVIATAVPEAPSDISIDAITTSTISISWTDNSDDESNFVVEYITGNDIEDFPGTATSVAANNTTVTITGLTPNSQYTFRVGAVGSIGTSTYSTSGSVYTYTNAPVFSFANKTTSSIQVGFVSADPGISPLSELINLTTLEVVTSTDGLFTLTGLTPNTTYQLVGKIYNADNLPSATSSVYTIVTYAVPPTTVTATVNSPTEIALSWGDSRATQYKVFQDDSLFASVAITSAIATGLTCETTYTFAVVAHNALDEPSLTSTTVSAITGVCPEEPEERPTASSTPASGGSSFVPPVTPSVPAVQTEESGVMESPAFSLNSGDGQTTNRTVQAMFDGITNVTQIALSNTTDFSGVSFMPFTNTISHVLTAGNGIKTVYAKLRSATGGTLTLRDRITLFGQSEIDEIFVDSECALTRNNAYKTPESSAVYYITKDCTKRGFSSADMYFTYFFNWSDVKLTTQTLLNSIPNDTIGFLPLGPRYAPTSGALVKTLFDPKTYLLLQGTLYHIEDEAAAEFQFGSAWATWIEGVDERLLQNYPLSDIKLNTTDRLDGMLIKYSTSNKVYQLATENNEQVKRWIPTEAAFQALNFRDDRIVTIPTSESYPDGTDLTS